MDCGGRILEEVLSCNGIVRYYYRGLFAWSVDLPTDLSSLLRSNVANHLFLARISRHPSNSKTVNAYRLRSILLTIAPALLACVLVFLAIFGSDGLIMRHRLKVQLAQVQESITRVRKENLIYQREIQTLRNSPMALRRMAAQELLMAEPGTVIYRFPEQSSSGGSHWQGDTGDNSRQAWME